MKTITLEDFKKINYNSNGLSSYKLINGICIKCKKEFSYSNVYKFMRNRKSKINKINLWDTCSKCWHLINTIEDKEWMDNNREIQLIIQSSEEQKIKNGLGVSKSWTPERKISASNALKDRWNNDDSFRKKALKNLEWTSINNERRNEIMLKGIGSGGLRGTYENIFYESALELSYILYCIESGIEIKRYDLCEIPYIDEVGRQRFYIPDFIINDDTIIEIKGSGLYYTKNYERNILKTKVLKEWCENHNFKYRIIFETSELLKKNYRKARKIHHANKSKKNIELQG